MKNRFLGIALMAIMVLGLGACGGGKKDDACDITKFTVGGKDWTITNFNISGVYEKTDADTWPAVNTAPTIVYSDKATISPAPTEKQDFSKAGGVKYTVTAESGRQQVYTVTATKQPTL